MTCSSCHLLFFRCCHAVSMNRLCIRSSLKLERRLRRKNLRPKEMADFHRKSRQAFFEKTPNGVGCPNHFAALHPSGDASPTIPEGCQQWIFTGKTGLLTPTTPCCDPGGTEVISLSLPHGTLRSTSGGHPIGMVGTCGRLMKKWSRLTDSNR